MKEFFPTFLLIDRYTLLLKLKDFQKDKLWLVYFIF